jgi:hypothetical protein
MHPTPPRLLALLLAALLCLGAVGDAFGHPPCCTDECTSESCPVQRARDARKAEQAQAAQGSQRPSCHADPDAPVGVASSTAPREASHGPAFAAPSRRCAEDCASGSSASFATPAAGLGQRVAPSRSAPPQSAPSRHDGGWTLPPGSRGPPLP